MSFEPFYITKADGAGTGLGLATVYGIVLQAEATIDIHSLSGAGTTFTILLPVTDEVATPVEEEPIYERSTTGETILTVEDEEALRQVTERIFTRSGYRVITAAHGADALAPATPLQQRQLRRRPARRRVSAVGAEANLMLRR